MKKYALFLAVKMAWIPFVLSAQSADTLWTANVLGRNFSIPTAFSASDSLAQTTQSASEYLVRDPRIAIRQYVPGSVSTISLGGANSEQTRILWGGIDISSGASGVLDLSLVPAAMISQSSIVGGVNSSSFDVSGIGSSILLENATDGKDQFHSAFSFSSIENTGVSVANGGSFGSTSYSSKIQVNRNQNNYSYQMGPYSGTMVGASNSALNFLQRFQGDLGTYAWTTDLWYTESEKLSRGSIITPVNISYLDDKLLRVKLGLKSKSGSDFQLYSGNERQSYTDTNSALSVIDTNLYTQWTGYYGYKDSLNKLTLRANYYNAGGSSRDAKMFVPQLGYERLSGNWKIKLNSTVFKANPLLSITTTRNLQFYGAKGYFSLGNSFRLPTLNELYWQPGGNPELVPERGIGAKWLVQKTNGAYQWMFTTDQFLMDHLIQWVPTANGNWSPINYKSVYTGSSTARISRVNKFSSLSWTYTLNTSRVLNSENPGDPSIGKSLIYRPLNQSTFLYEQKLKTMVFQMRAFQTGLRYTLRDNSASGILPAERWVDISLSASPWKGVRSMLTLHNVTNASRAQFQYYPLPGRYISIQLSINSIP